ncbi:hypothetical protein ACGFIU_24865 [Rhodococcus oryzae]|uniref:hypothetical protein n=1 Tax=Rhodococcus oryzae TaxID=2571143 RepID=UPI00371A0C25
MPYPPATKNAPGAGGAATEGNENPTNQQIEGDSLSNPTVADLIAEARRHNLPLAALFDAESGAPISTPSARWQARTTAHNEPIVPLAEAELMPASEAPQWADLDSTSYSHTPEMCGWRSRTYSVALASARGQWTDDDKLFPARADMYLYQQRHRSEPRIRIVRMEDGVDPDVATVRLSLDEAAELAHGILLAIDVARGITDEVA